MVKQPLHPQVASSPGMGGKLGFSDDRKRQDFWPRSISGADLGAPSDRDPACLCIWLVMLVKVSPMWGSHRLPLILTKVGMKGPWSSCVGTYDGQMK